MEQTKQKSSNVDFEENFQEENQKSNQNINIFDTHKIVKRFIAVGFTEEQAEEITEQQKSIIESNLANKSDIKRLDIKIEEVKKEVARLRIDFKKDNEQLRIDFKKDMEILKNKLVITLGSIIVIAVGVMGTLLKLLD